MKAATPLEKGFFTEWMTRARDLHELLGLLAVDGWDRMRSLRLAHALQNLVAQAALAEWHQLGHEAREVLATLEALLLDKQQPEP